MNTNVNFLSSDYQKFIHLSKYSRYDWTQKRRENWEETVSRWVNHFTKFTTGLVQDDKNKKLLEKQVALAGEHLMELMVVPSMRGLMTAGPALEKNSLAVFNCSYLAIDSTQAFDEILYLLACGTGVGFSVERQHVNKLPTVADEFHPSEITIKVADSKEGWAKALKELIALLYGGQIPQRDTTAVRAKGEPLMTFGGRASGPEPLEKLFDYVVKLFQQAAGRKLTSLECHDLVCRIADAIVSGGVRRCLDERYKINTITGWKKISSIEPGDVVKINGKEHAILNKFDNGRQETVDIKLTDGTTHNCTREHRWFVYNHDSKRAEWKSTEELSTGKFSMLRPKNL